MGFILIYYFSFFPLNYILSFPIPIFILPIFCLWECYLRTEFICIILITLFSKFFNLLSFTGICLHFTILLELCVAMHLLSYHFTNWHTFPTGVHDWCCDIGITPIRVHWWSWCTRLLSNVFVFAQACRELPICGRYYSITTRWRVWRMNHMVTGRSIWVI